MQPANVKKFDLPILFRIEYPNYKPIFPVQITILDNIVQLLTTHKMLEPQNALVSHL